MGTLNIRMSLLKFCFGNHSISKRNFKMRLWFSRRILWVVDHCYRIFMGPAPSYRKPWIER